MDLGDSLAQEALTTGCRAARCPAPDGSLRIAITLPAGGVQHFERPAHGGPGDWRATHLETEGAGFTFNEPVTANWGQGLDVIATS
ncbi:hypothetical protein AB0I10_33035 [Streptomyces sp. NPDC050636]|uniref:hypothetical protein n=1 Tax=Streptomyces sp. NPDC050636 TaxID=3154510 RepID=UPI003430DA6E